jgi:hypothetical protein
MYPDRYASAAVMSPDVGSNWIDGPGPTKSTYFLFGLTDKSAAELAPLARSWVHPPRLTLLTAGFTEDGYSKPQRAYIIVQQQATDNRSALRLQLDGSRDSPVVDPAVVIKDWGPADAIVDVDGKRVALGPDLREGHINRLGGMDLVLWIRKVAEKRVAIKLVPSNR